MHNRTPHADINDPSEQRIRNIIKNSVESTEFGRNSINTARQLQIKYFNDCLNISNPQEIYSKTQDVLKELSDTTNTKIVEGEKLVDKLPKGKPVFIALNHFGMNKLTTFSPKEIGFRDRQIKDGSGKTIDEIYPFPIYYAPIYPVAKKLNLGISEAHLVLPDDKLAKLQKEAGLIVIPEKVGEFNLIKERTVSVLQQHPNSLMVIFPEGKTSGKSNESHAYDILPFHTGLWGIATEISKEGLTVPIVTA